MGARGHKTGHTRLLCGVGTLTGKERMGQDIDLARQPCEGTGFRGQLCYAGASTKSAAPRPLFRAYRTQFCTKNRNSTRGDQYEN